MMRRTLSCAGLAWALLACGGTSLDLGSNDAGVPYDADCKPGTYVGTYVCNNTSSSPLQFSGSGPIAVTLVPGGAQALRIAPDASLSSFASGTASTSSLSGTLECATRQLTGQIDHVVFASSMFSAELAGSGAFTAQYDADASVPALVGGVLDPPSTLSTMCTWSATLQ